MMLATPASRQHRLQACIIDWSKHPSSTPEKRWVCHGMEWTSTAKSAAEGWQNWNLNVFLVVPTVEPTLLESFHHLLSATSMLTSKFVLNPGETAAPNLQIKAPKPFFHLHSESRTNVMHPWELSHCTRTRYLWKTNAAAGRNPITTYHNSSTRNRPSIMSCCILKRPSLFLVQHPK